MAFGFQLSAPRSAFAFSFKLLALSSLRSNDNIAKSLFVRHDHLSDGRDADRSRIRILDADDIRRDGRLHFRFLKTQIRLQHLAVDKLQAFAVAQRLRARNDAILEGYVFAVPCEIFAVDDAVAHHDVLRMPERILRIKMAVSNCESQIYWKEYFPFNVTFSNVSREDRIMKYSLSAVQSFIRIYIVF